MRNAYKILIENPEVKEPLWRLRLRSENNIKMDRPVKEIRREDVD
jgi:hypothetical protein